MRQLINSTFITLDGVIENPHLWPPLKAGTSGEGDEIQTDLLETCDIVLMGRRTYDVFAPAWSARSGDPYSDRINTMRKVVVSTTLTDPQWSNTEVIAGDVVARVRDLKDEDGGHIVQYGFGDVSRLLLDTRPVRPVPVVDPSAVGRTERRRRPAVSPWHDGDLRARGLEGPRATGSSWRPTGPDPGGACQGGLGPRRRGRRRLGWSCGPCGLTRENNGFRRPGRPLLL